MKKYLFLPFIALLAINGAFAVPASPTPFTVTQPDGTQLMHTNPVTARSIDIQ